MEEFKGTIYQAINIQNKKSYIGKTIQDFESYKQDHIDNALEKKDLKQIRGGKYFYNALRKYSPNNFKWIILGEIFSDSKQELKKLLNEAEKEAIWIFRTFGSTGEKFDNIYGYNKTKGGDGGDCISFHTDKDTILKKRGISLSQTLKNNPNINLIRSNSLKKAYKENPDIIISRESKRQETLKNNPYILINTIKKTTSTIINNPQICENRIINYKKTLKDNPEINMKRVQKRLQTEKDNPEIKKKRIESYRKTLKDNPDISINKSKKLSNNWDNKSEKEKSDIKKEISQSRILNKCCIGNLNYNFIKINSNLLISLYFSNKSKSQIIKIYNSLIKEYINSYVYSRFLTILDFPKTNRNPKETKKIKDDFIEENKHKIDWYINNYERLEKEYFENKWKEKYKELLITNN